MKLSQAKDYLPFVQAVAEGKTIQYRHPSLSWCDLSMDDNITNYLIEFLRVKPYPTYRPWKPEEVPVGALIHRKDRKWTSLVLGICDGKILLCFYNRIESYSFTSLLEATEHSPDHGKTWLPCGVAIN